MGRNRTFMAFFRALPTALLALLLPVSAAAQVGAIAGVVVDADSKNPLPAMTVAAYAPDGVHVFSAKTDLAGKYTLDVPVGSYHVLAFDQLGNFATGFSADAPSFEESPQTGVASGQTVIVNLSLHLGGKIAGTVTPTAGLTPVVAAYNLSGTRRGFTSANKGNYSIVLPPGTYKVVAYDDNQVFAPSFFNQKQTFASADPVTVTAQTTVTNISFALQIGARTAGVVTDVSGNPIANAVVLAYNSSGLQMSFAITAADGTFSMTLPPGAYRFVAIDPSFVFAAGYVNGANSFDQSPVVNIVGGQARGDLAFRLDRGGNVTGFVTDATTGAGIPNATVAAYNNDGTQRTYVMSDANGKYVLLLPPGTFRIAAFDAALTYAAQFYPQSTNFGHANPIAVATGQKTTLQPLTLSRGGHFRGTVADQTGAPVPGATVSAYDDGGNLVTSVTTSADGSYRLVVPPDSYRLLAFDPQLRFAPAYAGGVVTFSAIKPVAVSVDGAEPVISFSLKHGTLVSGTVFDERHAPVPDIVVMALDANQNPIENAISDTTGAFKLSLVPAQYKFLAFDPNGHYGKVYMGGASFADATTITVDATGAPRLSITVPVSPKRRSVHP